MCQKAGFMRAAILACMAAGSLGFTPPSGLLTTMGRASFRGCKLATCKPGLLRPAVSLGLPLKPSSRTANVCTLAYLHAKEKTPFPSFVVGDAVEAQWIGDDGWYAGNVENILSEERYDIRWADAQGLADTQVTEAEGVRAFDPAIYYRFGRGKLQEGDIVSAFLTFRTVFVCTGAYYDTYERMKSLELDSGVQALLSSRKDLEILTLSNRPAPSKTVSESEPLPPAPSDEVDSGMYTPQEMDALRVVALEERNKRAMWAQAKAFGDNQVGTWYGMFEDFTFDKEKDSFEPGGAGTYETRWESTMPEPQRPQFSRITNADEKGDAHVNDFYPVSQASWFVQNCFTLADMKNDVGKLDLEVGIKHGIYRARATFKYARGTELDEFGRPSWDLEGVRIRREKWGEVPTQEDAALFRTTAGGEGKMELAKAKPLTGAADRLSTEEIKVGEGVEVAKIRCAGSMEVEGPKSLPEAMKTGINKQVALMWNVPSVPGVGWDGKDRMVPAMRFTCARIFKWPGEELEMLSVYESVQSDDA